MTTLEPNFRVIAFDPGGTTGWGAYSCLVVPGMEQATIYLSQGWTCGHITGPNHHQELENFLGSQRVTMTTIVCERFDDRATGHHVNPIALEYIGVIKKWCDENDVALRMQMPSQAKSFVKDVNLKRLGIWQGKKWKHAMDAYRHLLWYQIHGDLGRRNDLLQIGWPNK